MPRAPAPGAGGVWCCKLAVSHVSIVTSPFKITPYRSPNRAPEGLYARAFSQKSRFTQPNHRSSCSGIGGKEILNFPPPSLSSHFYPVSGLFWSGLHLIVKVCAPGERRGLGPLGPGCKLYLTRELSTTGNTVRHLDGRGQSPACQERVKRSRAL